MYEHHLKDMAFLLVDAGLLQEPSKAEEILANYWADKIAIVWGVEDVKEVMADWHEEVVDNISDEKALQFLSKVFDEHDCNFDVTWDVIRAVVLDLER